MVQISRGNQSAIRPICIIDVCGPRAIPHQIRVCRSGRRSIGHRRAARGTVSQVADLQLLIDKKVVATAQETRGLDLNMMFLVDVSGSMKGSKNDSPLEDAKKALLKFLGNKRPQDRFELTSFADQDTPVSSFDNKSIENLKAVGNKTLLYQALHNALDNASKNRPKDDRRTRRIFIVISDGKDEGSQVTREEVMAESKASLIPIYTVFRGKTEPPSRAILELMANAGGGGYFFTQNETNHERA